MKRRRKKIQEAERKKEDCSSGSEKKKAREALLRGRPTSLRIRSGISGGPRARRQVIPANSAGDAVPKGSPALLRRGRSRAAGPREVFISVWAARPGPSAAAKANNEMWVAVSADFCGPQLLGDRFAGKLKVIGVLALAASAAARRTAREWLRLEERLCSAALRESWC